MQDKQKNMFISRLERQKEETGALKVKAASLKKENADIKKSLARSDSIINSMPVGLVLVQDKRVLRANDTLLGDLGYNQEDILGIDYTDLVHVDEREYISRIHRLWESGRISPDRYETRFNASSGKHVFYEIRCRRIRFQNRTAFLLSATGINERLEKEHEKTRTEKEDAIATMAAGIRDKLGPFVEEILEVMGEIRSSSPPGRDGLDEILKKLGNASQKAIYVNKGLEIIAGTVRAKQPVKVFSLNEAVRLAVKSAKEALEKRADAGGTRPALRSYDRSSSFVEGSLEDITDAIYQIITNAVDAMHEGGDIYITTEDNNGDAHVYIQDNGTGIADRHKDRVFDPFFTTKTGAMGLGLSMSGSVVKRHGGDIDFTSRDNEGTIFHIRLPITGQRPSSGKNNAGRKIKDSRIMIIQENDVAREVLSHALELKGCRITKAFNAPEGLAKLKNRSFDMVIFDGGALGMERGLFIERARRLIPGLSTVCIGDTADKPDKDRGHGPDADLIIKKPVDVNRAVKRISELLSEER